MSPSDYREIWTVRSTTSGQHLSGWTDLCHSKWATAWQDAIWFADSRSADMAGRVSGVSPQFWTNQQHWVSKRDYEYRDSGLLRGAT